MQSHLPPQWRQRLLAIANSRGWDTGQFAVESMRLLYGWQVAEGGTADWNPLNTTLHIPGWQSSDDYNAAGVCNYLKPSYGVMATFATLVNGYYNGILGFLQSPQITAEEACDKYADQFTTWGTDPAAIKRCLPAPGV